MTQPAQPAPPQPVPTVLPPTQPRTITINGTPLLGIPISTIIILIVAIVGGILLVVNGNLSTDFEKYAAIVSGSSGLLAIGRGVDAHAKP